MARLRRIKLHDISLMSVFDKSEPGRTFTIPSYGTTYVMLPQAQHDYAVTLVGGDRMRILAVDEEAARKIVEELRPDRTIARISVVPEED